MPGYSYRKGHTLQRKLYDSINFRNGRLTL